MIVYDWKITVHFTEGRPLTFDLLDDEMDDLEDVVLEECSRLNIDPETIVRIETSPYPDPFSSYDDFSEEEEDAEVLE